MPAVRGLLPWLVLSLLVSMVATQAYAAGSGGERTALNVSIAVFDPGVPEDQSQNRDLKIFPRIRAVEARFMPFVLRDTLASTHEWGAVRVVPEPDTAAELLVTGTILRSDGENLSLAVRAVDASGQVWLKQTYSAVATAPATKSGGEGSYQVLFDRVAVDLAARQRQYDEAALQKLTELSLIRYGERLAPSAFAPFLEKNKDGTYSLLRLPAKNDPMLDRIQRIRGVEYLFTDAIDEKFRELTEEIIDIYALWREHRRKTREYEIEDARWAATSTANLPRGSYEAIQNVYDNYKFHRVTQQEQDHLAVAFNNEVGPKVDAMETRIAELEFWVEQRYLEWNRLLEELFEVETGLVP
jgi:hypothetical protein